MTGWTFSPNPRQRGKSHHHHFIWTSELDLSVMVLLAVTTAPMCTTPLRATQLSERIPLPFCSLALCGGVQTTHEWGHSVHWNRSFSKFHIKSTTFLKIRSLRSYFDLLHPSVAGSVLCSGITFCPEVTCCWTLPQWGDADAEIKIPSDENTELKDSPFKAHACYVYCQGLLPC